MSDNGTNDPARDKPSPAQPPTGGASALPSQGGQFGAPPTPPFGGPSGGQFMPPPPPSGGQFMPPPPPPSGGQFMPPPPPSGAQFGAPQGQFGQPPVQGQFGQLPVQGQFGQPPVQGQFGQPPMQGQFGQQPVWASGPMSSGPSAAVDVKSVNPLDWAIIAAGVLAFLLSFFSFYKASVKINGLTNAVSVHGSAWHGFFGWFGVLCALVGAGATAALLFAPQIKLRAPHRLITAGAFALATLCLLLALVAVPIDTSGAGALGIKINKGHGFAYWIDLLLVVGGLALSVLRLQATGGSLPWQKKQTNSNQSIQGNQSNQSNQGGQGGQGGGFPS